MKIIFFRRKMMKYFWATLLSLLVIGCGSSADNTPSGLQGNGDSSTAGNQAFGFVVSAGSGQLTRNGDALVVTLNDVQTVRLGENGEGGELTLQEFVQQAGVSAQNSIGGSLEYRTDTETKQIAFLATRLARTGDGSLVVEGTVLSPLTETLAQDDGFAESFQEATFRLDPAAQSDLTAGSVVVSVTDPQGRPLPGVTVTLTPISSSGPGGTIVPPHTIITTANGQARAASLPPGTYRVTARLGGFQTVNEQTTVRTGRTTRLDVTLVPNQGGPFGASKF
jgi:hypothetical protein